MDIQNYNNFITSAVTTVTTPFSISPATIGSGYTMLANITKANVDAVSATTVSNTAAINQKLDTSGLTATLGTIIGSNTVYAKVFETTPKSGTTYQYTSTGSTFTAWGFNIGTPTNFNRVTINVKPRSGNTVTSISARIVDESNSAVLGTVSITPTISANTASDVQFVFPSPIINTAGNKLFFQFAANGVCDILGSVTDSFPQASWFFNAYKTNSVVDFTSFTNVSGGANRDLWAYLELGSQVVAPSTQFSDSVISGSTVVSALTVNQNILLTDTKVKVDSAFSLGTVESGINPVWPESGATFRDATSTYTGWGSPIGVQTNFNTIKFKVGSRSGNTVPISKVRVWVTENDKSGNVLADKIVSGLTITSGTSQYVVATLPSTIINSGGTPLFFSYKADQLVDLYGRTTGVTYPYPAFGNYSFTASGTIDTLAASGFTTGSSPTTAQRNVWASVSLITSGAVPTSNLINQLTTSLSGITGSTVAPVLKDLVTADLVLPSTIYAVEGKELNIWFANIAYSNIGVANLTFDVTCTKGIQLDKCFRWTPTASDAGTVPITIDVYFDGKKINTVTSNIYVATVLSGSGHSHSVVCVGDSFTNNATYISTITSEQSGDTMSLAFKGTIGSGLNKNEGRSGWRMSQYVTSGNTFYKFVVTGITSAPGPGTFYNDSNGSQYLVQENNITAGSGYISMQLQSGTGTPPSGGTLTIVSGGAQASINYTSYSITPGNAFWNPSTSGLSLSYYMTNNSISLTSGDTIVVQLGINDLFSATDTNLQSTVDTFIVNLRTFLNAMSGVTGLNKAIFMITAPAYNQDGFGKSYGTGQFLGQYIRNVKALQQRLITEFDNSTERANGNYLVPVHAVLDRENSFAKPLVAASARNSAVLVPQYSNAVHPDTTGYQQISDQLWAYLKYTR